MSIQQQRQSIDKKSSMLQGDKDNQKLSRKNTKKMFMQDSRKDLKSALQNIKLKQKIGNVVDKTAARRYQKLQKENFRLLNDLSVVLPEQNIQKQQQQNDSSDNPNKQSTTIDRLNQIFPPFNPSSRIKLLWDILQMILIPVHLVFQLDLMDLIPSLIVYTFIPCSLIIDIFVNLNTACFLKGVLITNRSVIFNHYLINDFKYDLIANIPLLIYCLCYIPTQPTQVYQVYRFIILSCFYKVFYSTQNYFLFQHNFNEMMKKYFYKVEDEFPLSTYTSNVISLVKLLLSILLNLHISALVWLLIAFIQIKEGELNTWMHASDIAQSEWYKQYIYSYYFSTVTMITVGYGDISPRTIAEKLLSILNMMIACGQFAYSVNSIGNIFAQFFKLNNEIKANMFIINNYMSNKNISKDLQYQVREYLEYYWKEERASNTDSELKILDQLSHKLKDTLLMEANKIALRESPIFSSNFSDVVVQKTLPLIKEIRCTPEEIIYLKGDQDDLSIYFIEKGQIESFTYQRTPFNKKLKTINSLYTLGPGNFFGAYNFFTGEPSDINIRSLEFTTLLKIKRSDFINLLKDYPDDHEIYCMLKDQLMYNKENCSILNQCQCCSGRDHSLSQCPLIHYVPQRYNIIRQFSIGTDQKRQKIQRKKGKKTENAYLHNYLFQIKMEDFVNDNLDEIKAYFRRYFIQMNEYGSDKSIPSSDINFDDYEDEEEFNSEIFISNPSKKCIQVNIQSRQGLSNQSNVHIPSQQKVQLNVDNQKSNQSIQYGVSNTKIQSNIDNIKCEDIVFTNSAINNSDKINQNLIQVKKPRCSIMQEGEEGQQNPKQQQYLQNEENYNQSQIILMNRNESERYHTKKKSTKLQAGQLQEQPIISMKKQLQENGIWQLYKKLKGEQNQQSIAQTIGEVIKDQQIDIVPTIMEIIKISSAQQSNIRKLTHIQAQGSNNGQPNIILTKDLIEQKKQKPKQAEEEKDNNNQIEARKSWQQVNQMQTSFGIQEPLDDTMRIYKFYFPQHNVTNIIENIIEKQRQKREDEKKKNVEQFQQRLVDNVMIQKRVRAPQLRTVSIAKRASKYQTGNRTSKDINKSMYATGLSYNKQNLMNSSQDISSSSYGGSDLEQSQVLSMSISNNPNLNSSLKKCSKIKQNISNKEKKLSLIEAKKVESFVNLQQEKYNNQEFDADCDDEVEGEGTIQGIKGSLNQSVSFSACRQIQYENEDVKYDSVDNQNIPNTSDIFTPRIVNDSLASYTHRDQIGRNQNQSHFSVCQNNFSSFNRLKMND